MKLPVSPLTLGIGAAVAGVLGWRRWQEIKIGDTVDVPVQDMQQALSQAAVQGVPLGTGNPLSGNADQLSAIYAGAAGGSRVRAKVVSVSGDSFRANPMLGDGSTVPIIVTLSTKNAQNVTPRLF